MAAGRRLIAYYDIRDRNSSELSTAVKYGINLVTICREAKLMPRAKLIQHVAKLPWTVPQEGLISP